MFTVISAQDSTEPPAPATGPLQHMTMLGFVHLVMAQPLLKPLLMHTQLNKCSVSTQENCSCITCFLSETLLVSQEYQLVHICLI